MPNKATPQEPEELQRKLGYIDEDAVFAMLGIAPGTGRNRQSAGTLPPHYKIGKKKLYRLQEVDAWVRRHRVNRRAAA